jgi:site-specific recombinase XerC
MTALAPTLQAFFTDRLARQRHASPETVAAYRDALRLLVCFASQQVRKPPSELGIDDLDVTLIASFLDHLEHERRNRSGQICSIPEIRPGAPSLTTTHGLRRPRLVRSRPRSIQSSRDSRAPRRTASSTRSPLS